MNLEDELRQALRREQPAADFTRRVLERVGRRKRGISPRFWMAFAAMLAVAALIAAGAVQSHARREAAARKAGRELVLALKITGSKLQAMHRMIRRRTNGV